MAAFVRSIVAWCRKLLGVGDAGPSPGEREQLSALFKERYHSFHQLLAANSKALQLMSEMEQASLASFTYGMPFIRARCTAVGVSVYRIVRHLDELAPGKYGTLFDRLQKIRDQMAEVVAARPARPRGRLVVQLSEIGRADAATAGAKMANLGEARHVVGARVPDGFVISAAAFDEFIEQAGLEEEIERQIQAAEVYRTDELFALSSRLQQLVIAARLTDELTSAIADAVERLRSTVGDDVRLAVRSSALGEDTREVSFAGQYRSQLNVRPENLVDAYLDVVASKYTPQAMQYRLLRGLRDGDVAMSVGCIAMVNAVAGGVAYAVNPGNAADRNIVVSATWGLPKTIVDGRFGNDTFIVRRGDPPVITTRTFGVKDSIFVCDPSEGVDRAVVEPERARQPCISDGQIVEIAELAVRLEAHFGFAPDIEWAIDRDGRVVLLQCRPLLQIEKEDERTVSPKDLPAPIINGGVCASPGSAAGPVYRVRTTTDALGLPEGAVLVLEHPLPRWAALLGRVNAVVAEEGNIAGHLATVARELRVPALFGVGSAEILTHDRTVTVDADGRAVFDDEVPWVLERMVKRPNLMTGSPVHTALREVLDLVAPLNLLDPDGVDFRPSSCQTLHDITRFCHEKSVREMFAFGKDHRFPRHASKQLHYKVPMQWWVLDLDDGFHHEVQGKYVYLEDIASIPMLALWQGLVDIPWDGPPAMTGRGMASVLFHATTNPALGSSIRRPYAQRNYFMISKRFMNLQSRFGFHFSSVEALVSERDNENYVSFSFKGGAADLERRVARVRMLAGILEDNGFEAKVIEDNAVARLGGLDAETTAARLRIVGYLIMHTRQLDMVMADPKSVERYRSKLQNDIASLTGRTKPSCSEV